MNISRPAISFACLLLAASALQATPILPGGTVTPQTLVDPGDVPVLAETSGNFSFTMGSGPNVFSGSYEQGVLVDPFGITCAGCLDFFYQVDVNPNSQGALFNVSTSVFAGFDTTVGWLFNGEAEFETSPLNANRSGDGNLIDFSFAKMSDTSHLVFPGKGTAYLIIGTNATSYDRSGTLGLLGGNVISGFGAGLIGGMYSPTSSVAVPEPASLALLGTGIAGLLLARRRKTVKPVA